MRRPLAFNSYRSRSLPASAQRLVNLYGEPLPPDGKGRLVLYGTPGLADFSTPGTGPIRDGLVWKNELYVVSGQALIKVGSTGTETAIGSPILPLTGKVTMAANATQIGICVEPNAYFSDGTTLTEITDPDLPPVSSLCMIDQYGIFQEKDSGKFWLTDLGNFAAVDGLDFATSEGSPDELVRVFADHRELWLFGTDSVEIWTNIGAADFPFQRVAGAFLERGCAAALSVAKEDNTVFWLGEDRIIYRARGFVPERVSTYAVEEALRDYLTVSDAEAFCYSQAGHKFYVLTFPAAGATWVYDISTGLWHERESVGEPRWRVSKVWNVYGKMYAGDYLTNDVYTLDLDTFTESGTTMIRLADSAPLFAENRRARMSRLQVEFETGVGLVTGQGSAPQAMLQWSDDGGRTYGNEHWSPIGPIGAYRTRAIWRQLGQFRERVVRVKVSDPVKLAIVGADYEITADVS